MSDIWHMVQTRILPADEYREAIYWAVEHFGFENIRFGFDVDPSLGEIERKFHEYHEVEKVFGPQHGMVYFSDKKYAVLFKTVWG